MNKLIGNLYVISAPSGTGKTTLVQAILAVNLDVVISVSYTTRPKRPDEQHGVNYYFVDPSTFEQMRSEQAFIEYATVFDHFYGTSKKWVTSQLARGQDVILEIDWQGYRQIEQLFPTTIGIFILPPSLKELSDRLHKRNHGPTHQAVVIKRLIDVKEAVSHIDEFKYIIVNDDIQSTLNELKAIIVAQRLLGWRQRIRYAPLIESMMA